MTVVDDPAPVSRPPGAVRADLVGLLRTQHHELRILMARVPQLRGAEREDVFLEVRRKLAVHEAVERRLVRQRLGDSAADEHLNLHHEVRAVERCEPDSPAFDAAYARMAVAHLHHAQVQEDTGFGWLHEQLSDADLAVAAAAARLWGGEGETRCGSSYLAMVAAANEELASAAG